MQMANWETYPGIFFRTSWLDETSWNPSGKKSLTRNPLKNRNGEKSKLSVLNNVEIEVTAWTAGNGIVMKKPRRMMKCQLFKLLEDDILPDENV
jgi:hypothetical protein